MKISFEKIIPNEKQVNELYFLLSKRKFSISHKKRPTLREHRDFVFKKNQYVVWYLLYKDKNLAGSVYINEDNSIGINLLEINIYDLKKIINYIKKKHKPLPLIKSLRSGEYFINVASADSKLIKILKQIKLMEIQRTFLV